MPFCICTRLQWYLYLILNHAPSAAACVWAATRPGSNNSQAWGSSARELLEDVLGGCSGYAGCDFVFFSAHVRVRSFWSFPVYKSVSRPVPAISGKRPFGRPHGLIYGHEYSIGPPTDESLSTVFRNMSTGGYSRRHTRSSGSKDFSINPIARPTPPPTTLTPENTDAELEPCAATASFLLYAQRNVILIVHHDTLAIERRFELHREDVSWITTDNSSERGSGRLAVSYDTGNTAIVWDILTGGEVARFSAYEHIKTACFMRNGNIAFGKLGKRRVNIQTTNWENQAMIKAILSCSSPRPQSILPLVPFLIQ